MCCNQTFSVRMCSKGRSQKHSRIADRCDAQRQKVARVALVHKSRKVDGCRQDLGSGDDVDRRGEAQACSLSGKFTVSRSYQWQGLEVASQREAADGFASSLHVFSNFLRCCPPSCSACFFCCGSCWLLGMRPFASSCAMNEA